jgi:DNA-binding PadR family transcriptional regulator
MWRLERLKGFAGKVFFRILMEFLDVAVLGILLDGEPRTGYELLVGLQKKYGRLLSAGSIYNKVYQFEREGLLLGFVKSGRRLYVATDQGKRFLLELAEGDEVSRALLATLNIFVKKKKGSCVEA